MTEQQIELMSQRLTEALILTCQIPKGIQLVAILGTGLEVDNREALFHWIQKQLAKLEVLEDPDFLGTLQERLVADMETHWL